MFLSNLTREQAEVLIAWRRELLEGVEFQMSMLDLLRIAEDFHHVTWRRHVLELQAAEAPINLDLVGERIARLEAVPILRPAQHWPLAEVDGGARALDMLRDFYCPLCGRSDAAIIDERPMMLENYLDGLYGLGMPPPNVPPPDMPPPDVPPPQR